MKTVAVLCDDVMVMFDANKCYVMLSRCCEVSKGSVTTV
jgi:hypothetical protein